MPRCENCPHSKERQNSVQVGAGKACVLIDEKGNLEYVYLKSNSFAMGRVAAELMEQEHPQLVEQIEDCSNPVTETVRRKGVLGTLGLTKTVDSCPALDFDPHSSEAVENYFVPSMTDL